MELPGNYSQQDLRGLVGHLTRTTGVKIVFAAAHWVVQEWPKIVGVMKGDHFEFEPFCRVQNSIAIAGLSSSSSYKGGQ